MEATTAADRSSAGSTGTKRDRVLAVLGALAGALAVSGSLLTWVTVQKHRKTLTFRGTTFTAGKLALIAGILVVAAGIVWIVSTAPRLRAASALIALAAGAAITIAIGAGLVSQSFFDVPATGKHAHQHHQKSASPTPSGTGTGAAFVPQPSDGSSGAGSSFSVTFQAMAGGGGGKQGKNRGTTSTLQPGVFIALGGGVLALIAGLWSLLGGRSSAPVPAAGEPTAADLTGGEPTSPDSAHGEPTGGEPAAVPVDPASEPTRPMPNDLGPG